jgi:hypothetical protein
MPETIQRAPLIRITPNTTNLTDFPQVNSTHPIARDLYNIIVFSRRNTYIATSISNDNSQITDHNVDNAGSWPNVRKTFDSKYGAVITASISSFGAINNINTFKTFSNAKGATLLTVEKYKPTTTVLAADPIFRTGDNFNAGIAIEHQSTGTEQQLRTRAVKEIGGTVYSPWVTVPTDTTLVITMTVEVGVGEKLYVNGVLVAEQTANVGNYAQYFINTNLVGKYVKARFGTTDGPAATNYFAAVWGRPLREIEVREISNNPLQLLRPQKRIQYLTTETPTPQPLIGGRYLKTRTTQPQAAGKFSGSNPVARKTTFLWTASNRGYDYAQTLTNGGSVNPQVVTTKSTNLGRALYATTTGAIEWEFREQTQYTQTSGNLRKGNVWTQGVVFRRNAAFANTDMYMVTNEGAWNHKIGIDVNGFVTAKVPGVNNPQISSDQSYALNEWIYAVLVHKQGDTRLYVNGQEQTQKLTGDFYTAGLGYIVFGPSGVDILTSFVSDREWTLSDIRSWTTNPWQLFQPEQHNFYTVLPSGVIVPRNRFLFFFN